MKTPSPEAVLSSPSQHRAIEVAATLGCDPARGLSSTEAAARLQQFGFNELVAQPTPPAWRRFLAQFQSPLVLLLLVATGISFVVWLIEHESGLPFESLAILAIVLLNAVLGFIQEARAERAVAALKALTAEMATVIRDGERRRVLARELVPGDLMLLEEGDAIPADGRLLESVALRTLEAPLTGESMPVAKSTEALDQPAALGDQRNMVFKGSVVAYGRGKAVVTATGMRTEVGKIAALLQATRDEPTPLQREIERVGRAIGVAVIGIAFVIVTALLLTQGVRTLQALVSILIFGVSLAVAAVPEGLATVMTVVLALGVQRMARRKAIVRKLAAVETLGATNVICTDKTGTLTRNEMTVRTLIVASGRVEFTGVGYAPQGEMLHGSAPLASGAMFVEALAVLQAATLANNSALTQRDGQWTIQGDPTEGALLVAACKAGIDLDALRGQLPRVGEVPFSSERKRMSTLHQDKAHPEQHVLFVKGAPDVLLARCTHERVGTEDVELSPQRRAEIMHRVEQLASQALRTLGVATRMLPSDTHVSNDEPTESLEVHLTFLGLVGMIDPPRPEVAEAVRRAQAAGVRVIMITGDHPRTALAIAAELGITPPDAPVVTGVELAHMDEQALFETVQRVSCYARVSPEHKLGIVRALRQGGAVVAMTGDGVNDAPALKTADIGIAMGVTGTDVSKEAADMVLADDNFATIVAAVEEGRGIYSNIRKFLRYLLSSNVAEVLTMFLGVLLAGVLGLVGQAEHELVLPLTAVQILWVNLVTDAAPALALGVDPVGRHLMMRPPRARDERVINREMGVGILLVGLAMAVSSLLVMDASLVGGLIASDGNLTYARTMTFTTLVLGQLFNVLNARSDRRSAFDGLLSNRWLWLALALSLTLQVLVIYAPPLQRAFGTVALSLGDWLTCTVAASSVLWARELYKLIRARRRAVTGSLHAG
ncbi:MAG: cation-translocating P-type ATPase [Thermoflexales bacterium]|nr:cation-translocating P-type ATPase [Thermoflexales bacterium]